MKLNKLIYLFFFLSSSCMVSQKKNISIELDSLRLINSNAESFLLKDTVFNNNETKFVVIYNSMNCKDCFKKIDNTLKKYKLKKSMSKVYVITTANEKVNYVTKYGAVRAIRKITSADNVFFEVAKQEGLFEFSYPKDGIFLKYNIEITPCILRIKNGKVKFFSYSSIFGNKSYNENWLE